MPQRTGERTRDQEALEWLMDEIECGTIEDVDELDEEDVRLLRQHYGETESLQDLLDSLRHDSRSDR